MNWKQLRLLDESGRISLTNTAVFVAVISFAVTQSAVSVAALLVAFAAYETKRFFINPTSDLAALEARINNLQAEHEETKNKLSALNIKAATTGSWTKRG